MSYYQHHGFICTHQREENRQCCAGSGSKELLDYAKAQAKALNLMGKGKCRINASGCLDRCDTGPIMVIYPDETWYRIQTKADVDEVIVEHLQQGRVVERLKI
jgi:(2Fe-2S) ferredoxin